MLRHQKREEWIAHIRSQHPEVDPRTMRLMDELRMVSHLIYQMGESSIAGTDLSYAQYRILMMLMFAERTGEDNGLNPSEISRFAGTSRNTISSLIRTLETDGYIERQLDSHDRRKFNITLTEGGRQLVNENVGRHMKIINEIFRTLSPEEMDQLSEKLHKLNDRALELKERNSASADIGGSHATSK
ncbi:MAG: MarR family transcriptional regulator [Chloroflexota bacterium]